jgi:hypothetical protein
MRLGVPLLILLLCASDARGSSGDAAPADPAALVQVFYDSYPSVLTGGLPRGAELDWLGTFLSDELYGRFRSVLQYQQDWIRQNPDRPPVYLKPPFGDGVSFTGFPDATSLFRVSRAERQASGSWHVPIHFWDDLEQDGWEARVVVKLERARYVIDDIIFLPTEPGEEPWCLSVVLDSRDEH